MELLKEIREYRVESELAATELIERSKNEAEERSVIKQLTKQKIER